MYSISQIAKKCGLSRTSLIHYDSIGLLCPSRTEKMYRMYTEEDLRKLEQICIYRNTGVSLEEIKQIFDQKKSTASEILNKRLKDLNQEISALRNQQQLIVKILGNDQLLSKSKVLSKEQWVQILKQSGLDREAMDNWHTQFERYAPEAHQDFLESLGIPSDEIRKIRGL